MLGEIYENAAYDQAKRTIKMPFTEAVNEVICINKETKVIETKLSNKIRDMMVKKPDIE